VLVAIPLILAVLLVPLRPIGLQGPPGWRLAQSPEDQTSSIGLTRLIGTVAVQGTQRFVAAQNFRESTAREASVKIVWLGSNFRRHFLGKIEAQVRPAEIGVHRLRKSARDAAIIADIGERHETRLAHLWRLLTRQPNGERGPLATNTVPNVFYIRNAGGTLWAVDVLWSGAGWEIGASAIDDPRPWRSGRQIMSR
jgi:hypothetical protein